MLLDIGLPSVTGWLHAMKKFKFGITFDDYAYEDTEAYDVTLTEDVEISVAVHVWNTLTAKFLYFPNVK